jgi:hypothetical protein
MGVSTPFFVYLTYTQNNEHTFRRKSHYEHTEPHIQSDGDFLVTGRIQRDLWLHFNIRGTHHARGLKKFSLL